MRKRTSMRAIPAGMGAMFLQIETSQAAAILRHFTFTLHNMNQHIGLSVHARSEGLAGAGRNRRIPVNDFRGDPAIDFYSPATTWR